MNDSVVHLIPAQAGIRRLASAFGAAIALSACTPAPSGDALFPLAAGHRWTYRITLSRDGAPPERSRLVLASRGAEPLDGAPAWRRHADSGFDYWLRSDAGGIYRVAMRRPLERAPHPDAPRRYVLKAPYAVGTQWQATTTTFVLQRSNEVPRDLSLRYPALPMAWRIESTAEHVETPAGRFDGCLRVQGRGEVRLFDDSVRSFRDVPIVSHEWYCPGVGLVRVERVEPSPTKLVVGGRLLMELTQWQ